MYAFDNNVPSQQVQVIQMANPGHWSNHFADKFLLVLQNNAAGKRQHLALADFFSLYAVTQKGADGSRDSLAAHIKGSANTGKVFDALFGNGTQENGLINGVIIGGTSGAFNTYPGMRYALSQLGFRGPQFNGQGAFLGNAYPARGTMPSLANVGPHYHHFHIYLQPPAPIKIEKTNFLRTADAPGNLAAAKAAQQQSKPAAGKLTPAIVLEIEKLYNKKGNNCIEYDSSPVFETSGRVTPGAFVFSQLKYVYHIELTTAIKTRITQLPKHGVMEIADSKYPIDSRNDPEGRGGAFSELYRYVPTPAYLTAHEAYEDTVSFEVEVNGQKFHLNYVIDVNGGCKYPENEDAPGGEGHEDTQTAIRLTLESITPLLKNGAAYDSVLEKVFTALGDPYGIPVSFAGLPTGALGQTTGTTVTLDDNAAGWGWFIDATPDLSEEFLPTADPTVWKATPVNGVGHEWHLLKLFRVPKESDVSPGQRTGFHQERIGFWSSFDGSWLDTAGSVSDTLLRNQVVEKVYGRLLEVRRAGVAPCQP